MNVARLKPKLPALVFGVWAVLLLLAAVFLFRSINRASAADSKQQRDLLVTAMRGCATEFGNVVQEVLTSFRPTPRLSNGTKLEEHALELYQQWRNSTQRPQLIGTLGIGALDSTGTPIFHRLHPEKGKEPAALIEWPVELEAFRAALQKAARTKGAPPGQPTGFAFLVTEERPVIVFPLLTIRLGDAPALRNRRSRPRLPFGPPLAGGFGIPPGAPRGMPSPDQMRQGPPPWVLNGQPPPWMTGGRNRTVPGAPRLQLSGWCFVELDANFLLKQTLPTLIERHFSGTDLSQYLLQVIQGKTQAVLFDSAQATPGIERFTSADVTETLLNAFSRLGPEVNITEATFEWRLVAQHRAGSLGAVAQRERQRNLLIGFGLLSLLFGSVALLVVTTQRAQSLAKRQLEFVAGVSHELRTPLSVIKSAGFNLASGRVTDAVRIKQYGTTIQHEGQRLSDMVEQMLTYAGIQAGRKQYHFQSVHLPEVIERALAEYQAAFTEQGWKIEKDIADDLSVLSADAQALESALKNLLHNALKYAAQGKWLRLSAKRNNQEIQITVADHGPGIEADELRNIFEPFYRGQGLAASAISGTGLGLSILQEHIKAHGGRVSIETAPNQGAAFTIHLPIQNHHDTSA